MSSMMHEYRKLMQSLYLNLAEIMLKAIIFGAGVAAGLKNWPQVTFAIEPQSLEQGLDRMKVSLVVSLDIYKNNTKVSDLQQF